MTAKQQLLAQRADQSAQRLFGCAYAECSTDLMKRLVVRDVHERNGLPIESLAESGVAKEEDEMKTFTERVIETHAK